MADICRGGRGGGRASFSLDGPAAERVYKCVGRLLLTFKIPDKKKYIYI
jgi:hypothetical protein